MAYGYQLTLYSILRYMIIPYTHVMRDRINVPVDMVCIDVPDQVIQVLTLCLAQSPSTCVIVRLFH